jgi:hypothetical protein
MLCWLSTATYIGWYLPSRIYSVEIYCVRRADDMMYMPHSLLLTGEKRTR